MQTTQEFVSRAHIDSEVVANRSLDFSDVLQDPTTITPPCTLWNSKKARRADGSTYEFDLKVMACGIHVLSGFDRKTNIRTSLSIAYDIASSMIAPGANAATFGRLGISAKGLLERRAPKGAVRPNVLYLNTLQSQEQIGYELQEMRLEKLRNGRSFDAQAVRDHLQFVTMSPGEIVERMQQLRSFIYERNIHVIVLNSFEFAYRTSRQKSALVDALQELRESMKVTIVVSTFERLPKRDSVFPRGPLGKLFGSAAALVDIGAQDAGQHWSETEVEYAIRRARTGPIQSASFGALIGERRAGQHDESKRAAEIAGIDASPQRVPVDCDNELELA